MQHNTVINLGLFRRPGANIKYQPIKKKVRSGVCKEEEAFVCQMEVFGDDINDVKVKYTWAIEDSILGVEEKDGIDQTSLLTMDTIYQAGINKVNFQVSFYFATDTFISSHAW